MNYKENMKRKNIKVGIFSKYRDFPIPSLEVILPSNEDGVAGVPTCEFLWLRPLLRKKVENGNTENMWQREGELYRNLFGKLFEIFSEYLNFLQSC